MHAKSIRLVLAVVVTWGAVSAAWAAVAPTAEWPGWRGPNRDGKSPDTGLLKEWPADGPPLLWKVTDIGHGYSGVAVSGGTVYITGDADGKLVLFAFDLDGKPKWKAVVDAAWTGDHPGARATPMIDGGKVYLVSGNGVVACLDSRTGRPVWSKNMREFGGSVPGWGYAESVLILGNLAVVKPGGGKCIVALAKTTGAPAWASKGFTGGAEYGSCLAFTFAKAPLIVAGTGKGIVCVSAMNGGVVFSNEFSAGNTANCPTPAYADGHVFWANGYGKGGVCLKLAAAGRRLSVTEAWRTSDMVCHHGGYVIHEGHIYGNNGDGYACLDLKTGKKMWGERGVGKGSLCWADGMLYLFGEGGGRAGLATCSPEGMQMKGEFRVAGSGPSWAHPVVIGGRLYLRYDTNLYCFDVKAK
ncbi:MAG TPA: PQQ-binding-like beta-propeller repeat protein [Phycisphaerae bacterium]|nr:PQQ-binding-like beta-propeller repeat protein [Phycisphaerae bacterium]